MTASVALLYAGLLALLLISLSVRIVVLRRRHRIGIGSGDRPELARAVRAHANFCEYVPIALILLVLLDMTPAVSNGLIHTLGGMLVLGRLLHAIGLSRSAGTTFGRLIGSLLSWLMIVAAALYGIWLGVGSA
ncbi:MAG: MAPEG family protein [Pseudomonadota bacterium]